MNKKSKIISSTVFVILIVGFFVLYKTIQVPETPVHYHANFAVFIDGKNQDFSEDKFMHIEPCSDKDEHEEPNDLEEKVHLHDNVGNVVHVHDANIHWEDLFKSLNYEIERKNVNYYLNGKKDKDVLKKVIQSEDKFLVSIGEKGNSNNELSQVGNLAGEYNKGKKTAKTCGVSDEKRSFFERFKIAFPWFF